MLLGAVVDIRPWYVVVVVAAALRRDVPFGPHKRRLAEVACCNAWAWAAGASAEFAAVVVVVVVVPVVLIRRIRRPENVRLRPTVYCPRLPKVAREMSLHCCVQMAVEAAVPPVEVVVVEEGAGLVFVVVVAAEAGAWPVAPCRDTVQDIASQRTGDSSWESYLHMRKTDLR